MIRIPGAEDQFQKTLKSVVFGKGTLSGSWIQEYQQALYKHKITLAELKKVQPTVGCTFLWPFPDELSYNEGKAVYISVKHKTTLNEPKKVVCRTHTNLYEHAF